MMITIIMVSENIPNNYWELGLETFQVQSGTEMIDSHLA